MTKYQQDLLDQAVDMWERGHRIPLTLFADMARVGMDVEALEIKHMKGEDHEAHFC